MPRQRPRPKSPFLITMGSVCLVAGALGLICGLCGLGGVVMGASLNKGQATEMFEYIDQEAPAWRVLDTVKPIGMLLLSFLVLLAGAGLLMRQRWGRLLAIMYAVIAIPFYLIHGLYMLLAFGPAVDRYTKMMAPSGAAPAPGFTTGFNLGAIMSLVFWLCVSAALLIAMFTPAASRALAPWEPPRDERDDEDDDDRRDRDDDY